MDWLNISLATMAVLGPYIKKAGESVAQKLGEDMYKWLKKRFDDDEEVQVALSRLEKKPDSERAQKFFTEILEERAEADPNGFGTELQSRIQQIANTDSNMGELVGQIIAGKVNIIGEISGGTTTINL